MNAVSIVDDGVEYVIIGYGFADHGLSA